MDSEKDTFARRLDSSGWGLFAIWVGIALLMNVGWGWSLFGVAAIILGAAAVRWFKALPIQGFWVAVGVIVLVCALWELLGISFPMIPVVLIGFGLAVLWGAFRGPHTPPTGGTPHALP